MTVPNLDTLIVALVVGIATGSIYALVAIAFNLVLSACGVFNLTISSVITTSVIGSYVLGSRLGWPPLPTLLAVLLFGAVVGGLAEIFAVRRVLRMRPKDVAHDTMVSTLGLTVAMGALAAILFGTNTHPVESYVSPNPIVLGDTIAIRPVYIVMPIVLIAVMLVGETIMRRTEIGVVTRAVIASNELSRLIGISVDRVVQVSFVLSGVVAALGGFLMAPVVSANAFVGEEIMFYGFAAIGIGGFGSLRGAVVGGGIVGLVLSLVPAVFNQPSLRGPFIWLTLVVVLFIRPAGLFGKSGQFGARAVREV